MDARTLDFIRRVLSVAECGQEDFPYAEVFIYADDNRTNPPKRQITYSIGFTETGNLGKVLVHYITDNGVLAAEIQAFIPRLGKSMLAGNTAFISLLKKAGHDPIMQHVQHVEFEKLYLMPAINWGMCYEFALPLSFLVIADSFLHSGSMLRFLMAKFPDKKPNHGGDEKCWITAYLAARKHWLENHSNRILNKTVYRANCFLIEASKGNWNLETALVMNGSMVSPIA